MKSMITPAAEEAADYKNLVDLLAVFSEATNQLADLENHTNREFLDIVDEQKNEYAKLQQSLTDAEGALKALVGMHPEWFDGKKTITTPYGKLSSRSVTSHEVLDEQTAIARIKNAVTAAALTGDEVTATKLGALIRVEETVNLEMCAELDESKLREFGISRIHDESITVKPAKVSLGQAVAAADKKAAKAREAVAA